MRPISAPTVEHPRKGATALPGAESGDLPGDLRGLRELEGLAHVQRVMDVPGRWALLGLGVWVMWHTRDA